MTDNLIKKVCVNGDTLMIDVGAGVKLLTVAHDTKRLVCKIIRPHLDKFEQDALDLIDLTEVGLPPTEVTVRPIEDAARNSGIVPRLPFKGVYAGAIVKVLDLSADRQMAGITSVMAGRKVQRWVEAKNVRNWTPL